MGKFSSLFRKSDKDKPDETNVNPYAQQPSNDTYSAAPSYGGNRDAPSRFTSGLPSGPRPGSTAPPPYTAGSTSSSQNDSAFSDNKKRYDGISNGSPATSSYGTSRPSPTTSNGYGNDRYGVQTGYGSNRYDNAASYGQNNNVQAAPQRQGGYGGLDSREQLYAGYTPQQGPPSAAVALPDNYEELTAEEKDEAQAQVTKGEIVDTLRDTAAITARSRQKMAEGLERMNAMNEMLYRDGQILNKVEQQISESEHQSRLAKSNLDNLDAANSSLWNFTANSRGKLAEREMRRELSERERQREKEELRKQEYQWNNQGVGVEEPKRPQLLGKSKIDMAKWTFDDDGEQEELNNRIEDDITALGHDVTLLNRMARAQGEVLEKQNAQAANISEKVSRAQQSIQSNNTRMIVNNKLGH